MHCRFVPNCRGSCRLARAHDRLAFVIDLGTLHVALASSIAIAHKIILAACVKKQYARELNGLIAFLHCVLVTKTFFIYVFRSLYTATFILGLPFFFFLCTCSIITVRIYANKIPIIIIIIMEKIKHNNTYIYMLKYIYN